MKQNYIAIDPGVGGGIAYIDTDGSVHELPAHVVQQKIGQAPLVQVK